MHTCIEKLINIKKIPFLYFKLRDVTFLLSYVDTFYSYFFLSYTFVRQQRPPVASVNFRNRQKVGAISFRLTGAIISVTGMYHRRSIVTASRLRGQRDSVTIEIQYLFQSSQFITLL